MANSVGPPAFGESRSLVLEEMDNLWVKKDLDGAMEAQHQMLSVRLYPDQRYIPSELHESISDARQKGRCILGPFSAGTLADMQGQ